MAFSFSYTRLGLVTLVCSVSLSVVVTAQMMQLLCKKPLLPRHCFWCAPDIR